MTMRKLRPLSHGAGAGLAAILAIVAAFAAGPVPRAAAEETAPLKEPGFSHEGPFGTYDRAALQRGLRVYEDVCAVCHSLNLLRYGNLTEIGFSEDEAKAIAEKYMVTDGPDEYGDMYERPAILSDNFAAPFPNEEAARFANGGALPPDLSLIAKAREGGENYLYSLLTGYEDPPAGMEVPIGLNYNPYFNTGQIAMPQPLFEDSVYYDDGTPATVEQQAHDVSAFLAWAAEPTLEDRKRIGFGTIVYLVILTVLLYFVNRKVWSRLK